MSKLKPKVGDIYQETIKRGQYVRYFMLDTIRSAVSDVEYYLLLFPARMKNGTVTPMCSTVSKEELKKLKYLGKSKMEFGKLFEVQDEPQS